MKAKKIYRVTALVLFLAFFVMPHAVLGANLTVGTGGDYTCIQDALDAAVDGDTITVSNGTYTGERNKNLNFNRKSLTLTSENGPEACIIDCGGDGRGIYFYYEGGNDTVDGFTIQNANPGNEMGGAIRCLGSSPTIRNCILKDNQARDGAGIHSSNSSPIIEDCKIMNNWVNCNGGGLYFYIGAPVIRGTVAGASVISGNHSGGNGGGIHGNRDAFINISNTTIEGNEASFGGGIYGVSACIPTITDCDIIGNHADDSGGAMYLWYSSPVIKDCVIKNNVAEKVGGIYSFSGSSPSLTNCVISHNTSSFDAGGILFYKPTLTPSSLVNSTICNNTGGGITFKFGPDVSIKNCIIWGNGSYQLSETGHDVTYSLVGDGVYGAPEDHNISGNPSFVDGYHLGVGSPCIGAGIDAGAPDDDIEGHVRSIPPCIGAYEADQVCYQLTIDPPVNGSITDTPKDGFGSMCTGGGGYSAGSIVIVTADPLTGYHFVSWSGDASGNDNPLAIIMDGDKTITATFAEGSVYSLTLISSPGAGGTITPDPDKSYYEEGEQVTLTAEVNTGYRFDGWSGDASGNDNPLTITMDGDKTITATFVRQYSLTVDTEGGGSVSVSPDDGVYDQGTTVYLTPYPDAGWEFDGWSGDASGAADPLMIVMDSDKNITATFIDPTSVQYTLTVNVVGGGRVLPGSGVYDQGTTVYLTPYPDDGCEFIGWGDDAWGNDNPLTVVMDSDKTIIAEFTGDTQYSLDLTSIPAEGGTITPNPYKAQYDEGEHVTLTAEANTGYRFDEWSGGGLDGQTNEQVTITMDSNKSITANFSTTAIQYELTVEVVAGNGSVAPDDGYYDPGQELTLTPSAWPGYKFLRWGGNASGSDNPLNIEMDSDKNITATFIDDATPQCTLTVSVVGQGNVTPDSGNYYYSEQVKLYPEADAGWEFTGWSGDAEGTADPLYIMMDSDKNITATFIEFTGQQYTLTLLQSAAGSISANPSKTSYNEGDEVTLTAVANTGYRFNGWSGDAAGAANPLTIIMDADKTVSAVFVDASVPFFTATPDIINSGEEVILEWFTPGEFGSMDGQIDPIGVLGLNSSEGSITVTPNQTTQYTLIVEDEPDRTVTVFVLGEETEVLVDEKIVRFRTTGGLFSEITPRLPAAVESPDRFLFGLFDFTVTGLTESEEIRVRVIMPEPIPAGAEYFTFQGEALLPYENVSGLDDGDNMFDITLVDGGVGDADNETNGEIKTTGGLAWVINLYFPHIACVNSWKTEIGIINDTGENSVTGQLKLYDGVGEEIGLPIDVELAPHGRKAFYANDFPDAESISHILFTAYYPSVITGYTKFYQDGLCAAAIPAVAGANQGDIHITHIASVNGWCTGVSLVNTTRADKEIDIVFNNGSVKTRTIPAGHRDLFSIRDLFDDVGVLPDLHSATIQNAGGIVGLEIFMCSNQLGGTLLRDVTAQKIYYPHVACDDGWATGIVAYNPLATPCDITITSYSETGENIGEIQTEISAYGRYCELVKNTGLPVNTAWLELTASQDITGLELFANGVKLAGYTSVGICSQKGVFPDLKNGGATGIAFVNTGSTDTVVTLTAYDDEGKVIATSDVELNAYCKTVKFVDEFFSEAITGATYIYYGSTTDIATFGLSASSDNMMLDALPGLH